MQLYIEKINEFRRLSGLPLLEYKCLSDKSSNRNVLKNGKVYIYGDDRENYTPHCHVRSDKIGSTEIEVSLIDFSIVQVKREDKKVPYNQLWKTFMSWLIEENYAALLSYWDEIYPNNTIEEFVKKSKMDINTLNSILKDFITSKHEQDENDEK